MKRITSLRALATACGSSPSVMIRAAKMPDFPGAVSGAYSVPAVKAWMKKQSELNKANPGGTYAEELKAKVTAQRQLLDLELEVKRGNLIDRDTVEMQQRAFVQVVQSGLLNMHTTLAMLVAGKTQGECETEIKGYARRMIESWKKLAKKENGK